MASVWKNGFLFPVVIGHISSLQHPQTWRSSPGFLHRPLPKHGFNKDKT
jgi:hypothetical protein